MARHRKMTTTDRVLLRGTVVAVTAISGLALLTGSAVASDNDDDCPEGAGKTCRVNNYEAPVIPAAQVGQLVAAQVKLLHCPGQIADIKAKVLRQIDPITDTADWAVKARVLVGQYCHRPPVIIVPVPEPVPVPVPAPLPEAPAPTTIVAGPSTPVPAVTH